MRIPVFPVLASSLALGLLPSVHAAGFSVVLDAGAIPRVDPVVAFAHGQTIPTAASPIAGAVFLTTDGKEVLADADPSGEATLWLQWPGELQGKSAPLKFLRWRPAPKATGQAADAAFTAIMADGKPAWTYHAEVDPAPEGKSPLFARSGFIHPLHAPDGSVLTGTRPPDHFHHMGLWHAWTKAKFQGKPMDFWNIGDGHGCVRFKEYLWRHQGAVWQGFQAVQECLAWPGKPEETRVLEETFTTRSWRAGGMYVLDYAYAQKNVSKDPLELEAYRYGGGIGFRGRPDWLTATSDYLTSEGKSRVDAHSTRARWLAASGKTESGAAGMAMLGAPENFDAPQHVRTWQGDHGGAIFSNFVPTQEKAAAIAPGATFTLRYRVVTFPGLADKAKLDAAWEDFAHPVTASVQAD